jgi:asparagine synthase (glutamine-hydrolysing)
MPRGERKGLLREVARRYLPADVVDRPKMGFAIPVGEWFRGGFGGMKDLLLERLSARDPFPREVLGLAVDRAYVAELVSEHMENRMDHGQRLYALLVLSLWAESAAG